MNIMSGNIFSVLEFTKLQKELKTVSQSHKLKLSVKMESIYRKYLKEYM